MHPLMGGLAKAQAVHGDLRRQQPERQATSLTEWGAHARRLLASNALRRTAARPTLQLARSDTNGERIENG